MDHPLTSKDQSDLRRRVVELLKSAYLYPRQSNIVFVCGGNKDTDMRRKFQLIFPTVLPEFEFFEPEFAMKNFFSSPDVVPFDITDFEMLVSELSHSVVIFPEAPGSFAETGYFSAVNAIASKILLVIDATRQKNDSFISLGPAKKIQDASRFHPNIQMDYNNPDFTVIANRIISRSPLNKTMHSLNISTFKKFDRFSLFCLIDEVVAVLRIATLSDIEFILRGMFSGQISQPDVKKIVSVLVGSASLKEVGPFGHLTKTRPSKSFLQLRDGWKSSQAELGLQFAAIYAKAEPEFREVMRSAGYAP